MRVTRSLFLCLAVAITAAGCAQQPFMRAQMVPVAAPSGPSPANMTSGPAPARGVFAASGSATAAPYRPAPPPPAPQGIDNQGIDNIVYGSGPARGVLAAGAMPLPASGAANPAPLYASAAPLRVAVAPVAYAPALAMMPAPPPLQSYTLDSGDRLRVVVFGQDGLTNSYLLDASGQIQMPLIGQVMARGLTTEQLSQRIAGMLRQGFVREPHVAVEIEAYRPFFILGEVTQPGQYPYVANMTVETAVAIAGGFGPRAWRRVVIISRNGGMRFEAPITYQICPGDTIQVQERWF
jgi:polysaccharide biosynthesis/export protein